MSMALCRCARYLTGTFSKNKYFIKNVSITARSLIFTLFRYRNLEIERFIINRFKNRTFNENKHKYISKLLLSAAILTFSDANIDESEVDYYKGLFDVKECPQIDGDTVISNEKHIKLDDFIKYGIVDESWLELSNYESFKMWRKLVNSDDNKNGSSEYTVCGSFDDISARAFQIVQTDVEYRKKWDNNIQELELIQSENDSNTETVRWVIKYPTFFKNREYLFIRRVYEDIESGYSIIISRSLPKQHSDSLCRSDNVNVTDYKSIMFIKSHGDFDEPGLSYCLIYFDDPKTNIPNSAFSYLSTKQIPEFMESLHRATLKWERAGYLDGIKTKRLLERKRKERLLNAQTDSYVKNDELKSNDSTSQTTLSNRFDKDVFNDLSKKLIMSFLAMVNTSRSHENMCTLGRNFQYYLGDSFSTCSEVES